MAALARGDTVNVNKLVKRDDKRIHCQTTVINTGRSLTGSTWVNSIMLQSFYLSEMPAELIWYNLGLVDCQTVSHKWTAAVRGHNKTFTLLGVHVIITLTQKNMPIHPPV